MSADRIQSTEDQISDEDILKLYAINKVTWCVWCHVEMASAIHEIVPRSKRPADWWMLENRAPLCVYCHGKAHQLGTGNVADEIRERRDLFITNFGLRISFDK